MRLRVEAPNFSYQRQSLADLLGPYCALLTVSLEDVDVEKEQD